MLVELIAVASIALGAPVFTDRPCPDSKATDRVRCGTVTVPEDRAKPGGRTIGLNVMVLRAKEEPTLPPLFDIAGGPGLPAVGPASYYLSDGAAYRAHRDIVLIDQRGTGGSNPLNCPEIDATESGYGPFFPPETVARCRQRLSGEAALERYGTAEAIADLDAVRAALGYEKIDLQGLSYGTNVSLRYIAAYPDRVRAAVLLGTAPPEARPPQHHAAAAQRALTLLFRDCASDRRCRADFPDLDGDMRRALSRLARNGELRPEVFAEKLRLQMYSAEGARRVPRIVHHAATGDLKPFYEATRPGSRFPYSNGMFLSVTCGERLSPAQYAQVSATARKTWFGDYRLRRQRAACAQWPTARVEPASEPVNPSEAAILFISGRLDPVLPPILAEAEARKHPNARHVVIRDGGHIVDSLSGLDTCFDPVVLRFFDNPDLRKLDSRCLVDMRAPPFVLDTAK